MLGRRRLEGAAPDLAGDDLMQVLEALAPTLAEVSGHEQSQALMGQLASIVQQRRRLKPSVETSVEFNNAP